MNINFHSTRINFQVCKRCVVWLTYVWFFKKLPNFFQCSCTDCTFPQAMYEKSIFSAFSPAFAIVTIFGSSYFSNRCVVTSHNGLNLYFVNGYRIRTSHLHQYSTSSLVKFFSFSNWIFSLFPVVGFLYILDMSPLSGMWFANQNKSC